jgi:hypothetical protein
MIVSGELSLAMNHFFDPRIAADFRITELLNDPGASMMRALVLQYQPSFMDILPLYITLLAAFPIVLFGLQRAPQAIVTGSFLLYLVVQLTDINLPAFPAGQTWFFDPFAWQFIFVIAAAAGYPASIRAWPASMLSRLFPFALVIALAATCICFSWTAHTFIDAIPALFANTLWPMLAKTSLAPIRLVHFLSWAIIIRQLIRRDASFLRLPILRPILNCGRNSLEIFCLSVILSVLGGLIYMQFGRTIFLQLAVNLTAIAAMILTAAILTRLNAAAKATARVTA